MCVKLIHLAAVFLPPHLCQHKNIPSSPHGNRLRGFRGRAISGRRGGGLKRKGRKNNGAVQMSGVYEKALNR